MYEFKKSELQKRNRSSNIRIQKGSSLNVTAATDIEKLSL